MLQFPQIDPVAISVGPLAVRWYGLMYLFGFVSAWILGRARAKQENSFHPFNVNQFEDVLTWGLLGVVVGARLGYVIFYNPVFYFHNPLAIFQLWGGGMSFHGGMLGVIFFQWWSGRRYGSSFFQTMDFMAPLVPPGLFFGRMGNFINGELWGRVTDFPLGMIFPGAGPMPRHPSQLYEAALEGVLLFTILWIFSSKKRPHMAVSGVFSLGYGLARFCVEFVREPDSQLGFIAGDFLTMGMLLCIPMILLGVALLCLAYRKQNDIKTV